LEQFKARLIIRPCGGLGNQLFIYAAARRLAIVNKAELVIDDIGGFKRDLQYRRHYQLDHFSIPCRKATAAERLEPFVRFRRDVKRRLNQNRPFETRSYLTQEGIDFDPRMLSFRPRGRVYLEGYWQSELYFIDVQAQILDDLRIVRPTDSANQEMAAQISASNAVALHVRFFNQPRQSPSHGANDNLDERYYCRAISVMEERLNSPHYYVFSDQAEAALQCVALPLERTTLVSHNKGDTMAHADLWLMSQCKHFIIANSTFSWWGAWLAPHLDKIVIAPGYEKREGASAWGFSGLVPDRWLTL
jgi:hypothetical protein